MKVEYDQEADAIYLSLASKKQRVWKSRELESGVVVDMNKKKQVVGIEILEASRRLKPTDLFQFSVKRMGKLQVA